MTRAGQLFEINSGDRQAMVSEQGATLYQVRWGGTDLLTTAHADGWAGHGCHGQLLAPWPGRIRNGTYHFEGESFEVPIDDRTRGSAIHGWVRWATWQPKEHMADRITMRHRMFALPGYPFPLEYEQSYSWQSYGLEISTAATNLGARTAPFGLGFHPYFTSGSSSIDDCVLQVRANKYFENADDMSPVLPALPVDGTRFDFREPIAIGATPFDVTLADLERDDNGRAVVKFHRGDGDISITCKYDDPIKYVQLYTGDTLGSHRRGVAVEPYTCAPDAFNNGLGLILLAPGASVRVRWTLSAT